mmetsp:Transcript_9892/g.13334  ORF Transcript_9892/g.13334 Transcript_9892/m.13334 type:complete len:416 (-) Transcript_9892:51-1298(-)
MSKSSSSSSFERDIPFSEPEWCLSPSPFYSENHSRFRDHLRKYLEANVAPHLEQWEMDRSYPPSLHKELYQAGIFGATFPAEYGGTPPEGGFDLFMGVIMQEELARVGGGWSAACFSLGIAIPPILHFGSRFLKENVARPCIKGEKIISLCITEPQAGSDVANLTSTAFREGDFYILSGEKKFITSGIRADYFTVACRTGKKGMRGVSLLVVDANSEGVTRRSMKTTSWHSSNTALLVFDKVKVPVQNLIGKENEGFLYIMLNFNQERLSLIVMALSGARRILNIAIRYASSHKESNKLLIDDQAIRHKIADMARELEAARAWLDQLVFQLQNGTTPPAQIGGAMALLKVHSTKIAYQIARGCSEIVGGDSVLRTGMGAEIDRFYRDVRVLAIGGGSEEVMTDLAMNMALGRPKL